VKKNILHLLILILLLSLVGCSQSQYTPSEKVQIAIRGNITKLRVDTNHKTGELFVEGKVESDTIYDKATIRIDKNTRITRNGDVVAMIDLKEGMEVDAVFTGPVAESYPVQAQASIIQILNE
jgi:beta-N-acetylhexosaminidase